MQGSTRATVRRKFRIGHHNDFRLHGIEQHVAQRFALVRQTGHDHVGVPDEKRAKPQRLLLTVGVDFDFSVAVKTDNLAGTIDYFAVTQRLLKFGEGRSWKLIEKLAADIADAVLSEFKPESVTVKVRKFPMPQARCVSVSLNRKKQLPAQAGTGTISR